MTTDETAEDLDEVMFEGDETPLLLRKTVVAGVVLVFLALVGAYVVATLFFGVSLKIDAEPFRAWVEERGVLGVVVFVLVMAFSVLFAPVPNVPIFIAAGLAWGPVLGTAYCMAGQTLGSLMAFEVARKFGRKHLSKLIGRRAAKRLDSLVDNMGAKVVFWTRMMPGLNFDWISYVAGMTSVPLRTFIVFSFLGMLAPTTVTVVMGDGLTRNPAITLAMGALWVCAILATAGYFWMRRRRPASPVTHKPETPANAEAELG